MERDARDVRIVKLDRPLSFRSPFEDEEFVLLLADGLGASADERNAMAAEIVAQGCRYAVCWGRGCAAWEITIDWADVASWPDVAPPEDRFVMTTSHQGEPAMEAVHWFLELTAYDFFVPRRFLVLILGDVPDVEAAVRAALDR